MEPMRFSTGRDALDATIKRAFSIRSAAGLWKCGQGKRLDHSPTGEQKQKKRTFDVLPNPAKLISYRQQRSEPQEKRPVRARCDQGEPEEFLVVPNWNQSGQ